MTRCAVCRQPIDTSHSWFVLERGGAGRPHDLHLCSLPCLATATTTDKDHAQ